MKKIMLLLLCLFSINMVYAEEVGYEDLDFYVRLERTNYSYFVPIKRFYDKDTFDVLFSLVPSRYAVRYDYEKDTDISRLKEYSSDIDLFNKIVYVIYENNKSELNYIMAQILMFDLICDFNIVITDDYNNPINDYNELYKEYKNKVLDFSLNNLNGLEYKTMLWDNLTIPYKNSSYIKNINKGNLDVSNDNENIYVNSNITGNYKVDINKNDNINNYVYYNSNGYFIMFSGELIQDYFNVSVSSINLKIKENIVGVNNKYGDSLINKSNYELYLDNELKLNINDLNNNDIRENSTYILKDKTDSIGILNSEDVEFTVNDTDYVLEVNKYVISKNISIDIKDNYTYYIYLKSNNELYSVIDKNTDVITLPYGTYYINSKDNSYVKEIEVINSIDDVLVIDNSMKEIEIINIDKDIKEDIINEEEIIEVNNPKTLDNIYLYILLLSISLGIILSLIYLIYKCNKDKHLT